MMINEMDRLRYGGFLDEDQEQMLAFWLVKKMLEPGVNKARSYYFEAYLELESKLEESF